MYLRKFRPIEDSENECYDRLAMVLNVAKMNATKDDIHDFKIKKYENKELLELFKSNPKTEAIILDGHEPLDNLKDLTEFIRDAREFFYDLDPKSRPKIIIHTNYLPYWEKLPGWLGFKDQLELYGNCYIRYGQFADYSRKTGHRKKFGIKYSPPKQGIVVFRQQKQYE